MGYLDSSGLSHFWQKIKIPLTAAQATADAAQATANAAATMEQVNAAIDAAITGAIEEAY